MLSPTKVGRRKHSDKKTWFVGSINMIPYTWISSLKVRWVVPYFASSLKALWFAKSSNCRVMAASQTRITTAWARLGSENSLPPSQINGPSQELSPLIRPTQNVPPQKKISNSFTNQKSSISSSRQSFHNQLKNIIKHTVVDHFIKCPEYIIMKIKLGRSEYDVRINWGRVHLYQYFFTVILFDSSHEFMKKVIIFLKNKFPNLLPVKLNAFLCFNWEHKMLKPSDPPSCPPLSEPNVKLILQQLLVVCPHINGNGQTLHKQIKTY